MGKGPSWSMKNSYASSFVLKIIQEHQMIADDICIYKSYDLFRLSLGVVV
jgi:hypothetical protein